MKATRKSLAEALRENRVRCKMTQEFVSETIGVSRQAVSKWENGSFPIVKGYHTKYDEPTLIHYQL